MKSVFFLLLFIFLYQFYFSQITDSVVIINDYFTIDQARKRKYQSRDSVVANTKKDNRVFRMLNGKYTIDNKPVDKGFYFVELQKQTDEKYRPFKRVQYYKSGKLSLRGNFFNGDGLLDSCKSYYPDGKLQYFSKNVLDTLENYQYEGINYPKFSKKSFFIRSYNASGILTSIQYGDKTQYTEEVYNRNGTLKSKKITPQKNK